MNKTLRNGGRDFEKVRVESYNAFFSTPNGDLDFFAVFSIYIYAVYLKQKGLEGIIDLFHSMRDINAQIEAVNEEILNREKLSQWPHPR